jgi:hypothetical protein
MIISFLQEKERVLGIFLKLKQKEKIPVPAEDQTLVVHPSWFID